MKQSKDIKSEDFEFNTFEKRKNFDLLNFLKNYCESICPSGITFFRTEYEVEVSLKYQDLKIQEPEYIPPDFHFQKEKNQGKKVKLFKDRW